MPFAGDEAYNLSEGLSADRSKDVGFSLPTR